MKIIAVMVLVTWLLVRLGPETTGVLVALAGVAYLAADLLLWQSRQAIRKGREQVWARRDTA